MALTKDQKKEIIDDLKEKVKNQKIMIFVNFTGLKVKDFFELRKKLTEVHSRFKVTKRTLLNIVFKNYNSALSQKVAELKGQIAVIFGSKEEILPAKTAYQFSLKNPNLRILGGYFEKKFRDTQEMIILAQLPTRDGLLTKLVISVKSPISNFVNIMEGNLKGLIFALNAIKNKK